MNANEIVDLLRACSKGGLCSVCPLDKGELDISCIDELMIAAIDLIESLQAQLTESQRRERAAVEDLHHNDACSICVGSSVEVEGCDAECLDCKLNCRCKDCRDESKWQWRGPQETGEVKQCLDT